MLLNCFLNLDIYGTIPSFTIHGHKKFRTIIGSILSLLTYIIIILFFGIYIRGVLKHLSPKLVTTIYNDFDPKPINLTKDNFLITLSLQTIDYSNYINDSIYYVNATLSSITLQNDGSYQEIITPLKIIKCSEYNFHFLNNYWKNLPLESLYCLDIDNIELRGDFKTEKWNVLYLKFSKCINTTENNNSCQSNEVIDNYLKGGYLGIFMSDIIIEPNNFQNPSQLYGKNIFNTFTYKQYSDFWIYLKHEQVVTDLGYFFENKNTKYFFGIDHADYLSDYREDKNIFLSVGIRKSLKREVYERSYVKLQEAAANACGIIKVSMVCGEIIAYFFQKILYNNFIIQFVDFHQNQNYQYQNYNNVNGSNQLLKSYYIPNSSKGIFRNKTVIINQPSTFIYNKNKTHNKISLYNYSSVILTPKKNIHSSYHSYFTPLKKINDNHFYPKKNICFSSILCKRNFIKKMKYIFRKYNKIEYCFDIIQYLKIQYEIGLIKNIVFDEETNKEIKDLYFLNYHIFSEKESYDKIFNRNQIT